MDNNDGINKQAILSKRIDSLMNSGVEFDPEAGASAPDANRPRKPITPSDHANALVDRIGQILGLTSAINDATPRTPALPDPTVTGPCLVQATFGCAKEAAGERLIPTSMLPDALIPGPLYAPMCLPCYEHLSTVHLTTLHQGEQL